ncbi:MAG: hypothetical protein AAGK22_29220 [Acidobacteriota bacterium]
MNEGGDNDKLGRGAVWESQIERCVHQNHVFAVRPMPGIDSYWMALAIQSVYLKHFFMRRSKQSTNLASISSTNLKEAPFVMPPDGEARAIRTEVEDRLRSLNTLRQTVEDHVELLHEFRQAVITAAVTGGLDVEAQEEAA